ncbi:MAG TPA: dephospho-CoA kinase, partial [Abditibacteriaceae bacterium]
MILGLTGGIASGKSTVARLLKERGAVHIDADTIVRELYADTQFAGQVQALFEKPILDNRGEVDRARLGQIVFNDAEALNRLEKLV